MKFRAGKKLVAMASMLAIFSTAHGKGMPKFYNEKINATVVNKETLGAISDLIRQLNSAIKKGKVKEFEKEFLQLNVDPFSMFEVFKEYVGSGRLADKDRVASVYLLLLIWEKCLTYPVGLNFDVLDRDMLKVLNGIIKGMPNRERLKMRKLVNCFEKSYSLLSCP